MFFQHLLSKEKESPSQLSDFVAAAAAEAEATETNLPLSATLDDTNNQTNTSDEQQTPVSRAFYSMDTLQRKSSSNTNSSLSSSTSVSPIVQQKSHSRSSSSSSSNSSLQKKAKLNDEMNNNRSLNDLSQFVQLNKEEGSFLPPQPPPPPNQSDAKEDTTVITKSDSSIIDTKFVFNSYRGFRIHRYMNFINKQKDP